MTVITVTNVLYILLVWAGEASVLSIFRRYLGKSNHDHFDFLFKLEDLCEAITASNCHQTNII